MYYFCCLQTITLAWESESDVKTWNLFDCFQMFSVNSKNNGIETLNYSFSDLWFWPGTSGRDWWVAAHDSGSGDAILPSTRDPDGEPPLFQLHRYLVCWVYLCWAAGAKNSLSSPESHPAGKQCNWIFTLCSAKYYAYKILLFQLHSLLLFDLIASLVSVTNSLLMGLFLQIDTWRKPRSLDS